MHRGSGSRGIRKKKTRKRKWRNNTQKKTLFNIHHYTGRTFSVIILKHNYGYSRQQAAFITRAT